MGLPSKAALATLGSISVGIGGAVTSFSLVETREFLNLVTQYLPLLLCIWLLYKVHILGEEHTACRVSLALVKEELFKLKLRTRKLESETYSTF